MTQVQILYWHDIPVQVRAGSRRDRVGKELAPRFQAAVDQAAMAANLTNTDDYLNGFHWSEVVEREGTAGEVAEIVTAELEASFPQIDWQTTARSLLSSKDVPGWS